MRWLFYAIYPLHLALIGALLTTGVVQKPRPKPAPSSTAWAVRHNSARASENHTVMARRDGAGDAAGKAA
jgi:hypothetical protein